MNKNKIPEIFFRFRFRNFTERKSKILGFLFSFACKRFCEDGTFAHKNEEKDIQRLNPRQIRQLKNRIPRKIRSAEIRP